MAMNVLIRGLSEAAVARIDAEAASLGLSRNEFLRRRLEGSAARHGDATLCEDDWVRSATVFADLEDAALMVEAWR